MKWRVLLTRKTIEYAAVYVEAADKKGAAKKARHDVSPDDFCDGSSSKRYGVISAEILK